MLFSPHDELPLPDNYAHYWRYRFQVEKTSGVRLKVTGDFPYARYMSFNAYDQATGDSSDSLPDMSISADTGATNPFTNGADRTVEARQYTVWMNPYDRHPQGLKGPSGISDNVIHMPKAHDDSNQLFVELWYRVYFADHGRDTKGGVDLPKVQAFAADGSTPATCPVRAAHKIPAYAALRNIPPRPSDGAVHFYFPDSAATYANRDNKYLGAQVNFAAGDVAVMRFRVPTSPRTVAGGGTFNGLTDVRYWSLCVTGMATDTPACLADEDAKIGADGTVTFVMGPAEVQDAAMARGFNYLPRSRLLMPILVYRNMLTRAGYPGDFKQVTGWPRPRGEVFSDPTKFAAENAIGAYAPTGKHCSIDQFLADSCGTPSEVLQRDPRTAYRTSPRAHPSRRDDDVMQVGLSWSVFFAALMQSNAGPTDPSPADVADKLATVEGALQRFLEARTGRNVAVETVTLDGLIEGLNRGDYDIGFMPGIDYQWGKVPYPNLRPMVFANFGRSIGPSVTSYLLTRAADGINDVTDLKGQRLAGSRFNRFPDLMFLRQLLADAGQNWVGYFAKPEQFEDDTSSAIDDVVNGNADLIAVGEDDWSDYQSKSPLKARKLDVTEKSNARPAPTMVYNTDKISERDIAELADALVTGPTADIKTEIMVRTIFGIQTFGLLTKPYLDLLDGTTNNFQDYSLPTLFYGW